MTGQWIVDGCAGPGGWDEGIRRYLDTEDQAVGVEWDNAACKTRAAAGHLTIQASIADYPPEVFRGKARGLIKSVPCQAWSKAGKQLGLKDQPRIFAHLAAVERARQWIPYPRDGWHDDRSPLVLEPLRWALAIRPEWIALEQVEDVLPFWRALARVLEQHGYSTWCGVLSSEMYGVPQTRKRAFLVASRVRMAGPPEPTHQRYVPGEPSHGSVDLFGGGLSPWVSMAEALGWGLEGRPAWTVTGGGTEAGGAEVFGNAKCRERLASEVAYRNGNQANSAQRPATAPAPAPAPTVHFGERMNLVEWVHERPATTVCGDSRIGRPGHKDRDKSEAQFAQDSVRVTVEEAGVLQSFPRGYPWQGTSQQRYLQVGNAVPPLLAAHVVAAASGIPWRADVRARGAA